MGRPALYIFIPHVALSGWALSSLWRHQPGIIRGTMWSVVILALPLLGPLFYAAFFSPPPPLPPHLRVGVHSYVAPGGQSILDEDHGVAAKAFTKPWLKNQAAKVKRRLGRSRSRKKAE